eukprot:6450435-Amphidinium_carterae.1
MTTKDSTAISSFTACEGSCLGAAPGRSMESDDSALADFEMASRVAVCCNQHSEMGQKGFPDYRFPSRSIHIRLGIHFLILDDAASDVDHHSRASWGAMTAMALRHARIICFDVQNPLRETVVVACLLRVVVKLDRPALDAGYAKDRRPMNDTFSHACMKGAGHVWHQCLVGRPD